jgi:hypothetical protein
MVSEARSNALPLAELQIDFDCPESKLAGYAKWVGAIRAAVSPLPVTITALPAWLKRQSFKQLINVADGYVLQVHSLERPRSADAKFTLCDPAAAREAVERAAHLGKLFRVALPTYGYMLAFDVNGRFAGVSAENPAMTWPKGTQLRELSADPNALADLVKSWTENRPSALAGLIWYRLPIAEDTLNWRWATLAAVMNGATPRADVLAQLSYPSAGLVEIALTNTGAASDAGPMQVTLSWQEARLVACDALRDFDVSENGASTVHFKSKAGLLPLLPGENRMIGWMRLSTEAKVRYEIRHTER